MRRLFVERFIESYQLPPSEVVLDIDGWDDPTHGQQELSGFHGYYGHHMYFPVLINEERLRSALIKGAARVRVSARRVLVELAAFCPFAQEIRSIAQRLCEPWILQLG